jgi:hypothetical protein
MLKLNQEAFMALTLDQVSQVYSGKRDHCRCGCGGTYTSTSKMENPRSQVNDSLVEKRLSRAKRLVETGAEVDYGDAYIDIKTGNNRSLTFYVDELKSR